MGKNEFIYRMGAEEKETSDENDDSPVSTAQFFSFRRRGQGARGQAG
jgi:hypothetical protein